MRIANWLAAGLAFGSAAALAQEPPPEAAGRADRLPEAAFANHPDLFAELDGPPSVLPFLGYWGEAEERCVEAGFLHPVRAEAGPPLDLMLAVRVETHRRAGYTAHVVVMPAPVAAPEAHLVPPNGTFVQTSQ